MNKHLENLHRSHMGFVKTKERAIISMFWPKIYNDIENFLSRCHPCMSHKIKQATEPLEHDVPTKPWCSLTLDNFKYKGSLYLIIYDRFTRFIVVKNVQILVPLQQFVLCWKYLVNMVFYQTFIQIGAETLCQKNLIHFVKILE